MHKRTRTVTSSDQNKKEIKEMLTKYDAAAKRDHRYMSPDEKDTPRKRLLDIIYDAKDEDQKTIRQIKQSISEIKTTGGDLNYYSKTGGTPIGVACLRNKPNILKLLIEEKADYHFTHSTVLPFLTNFAPSPHLVLATRVHAIECMKVLIDAGASPSEENKSFHIAPLHVAAKDGQIEELKLLLSAKADINPDYDNPLNIAAKAGQHEAVKLLISAKANINAKNYVGSLPIHSVASRGHFEIAQSLIAEGADINAKNSLENETPLILAIYGYYKTRSESHALMVHHLISLGAEPKFTSNPITTDIVSTKSIFNQLRQHNKYATLHSQELEDSLAAYEINKGIPEISFKLCMLISEYLKPDFFEQDILAEQRSQRIKQSLKPTLLISGAMGIAFTSFIFLLGTFGSEQQKAQIFSSGNSLGYESLKMGLLTGMSFFASQTATNIGIEYRVFDKIKRVFKR